MSVYTPGIPASGSSIPAQDRSLISQNFTQLNSQFGVDHTAFSAGSLNGYHTTIHLTQQSGDPAAIALAPIVYAKLSNSIDEIFMRRASGDGSAIIQMTCGAASTGANTAKSTSNGQSFLPGGFQLKWGRIEAGSSGQTISYTADANLAAFPNATLQVQLTPFLQAATNTQITNITQNGFTYSQNTTGILYWFAIGN